LLWRKKCWWSRWKGGWDKNVEEIRLMWNKRSHVARPEARTRVRTPEPQHYNFTWVWTGRSLDRVGSIQTITMIKLIEINNWML
jgi:hypothetical protein